MSRIFGKKEFAIYVFVNFVVWITATLIDGFIWLFRYIIMYGQIVSGWSTERLAFGTLICGISAAWALDASTRRDEPHPMFWIVIASILFLPAFFQFCCIVAKWGEHDGSFENQIC